MFEKADSEMALKKSKGGLRPAPQEFPASLIPT